MKRWLRDSFENSQPNQVISKLQVGNVVVKKMTLHPFVLLLWRDGLRLGTQDLPLMAMAGHNPFPRYPLMPTWPHPAPFSNKFNDNM